MAAEPVCEVPNVRNNCAKTLTGQCVTCGLRFCSNHRGTFSGSPRNLSPYCARCLPLIERRDAEGRRALNKIRDERLRRAERALASTLRELAAQGSPGLTPTTHTSASRKGFWTRSRRTRTLPSGWRVDKLEWQHTLPSKMDNQSGSSKLDTSVLPSGEVVRSARDDLLDSWATTSGSCEFKRTPEQVEEIVAKLRKYKIK